MTHSLNLEVSAVEGALVRVLGMTERRGFRPVAFSASSSDDALLLSLTVFSERPIELLIRQLEKLFDVRRVDLASEGLRLEVAR